jgi:hypothetical protein
MAVTGVFPVGTGPRFFLCNTGFDTGIKPCITQLSARWKAPTFTPGLTEATLLEAAMARANRTTNPSAPEPTFRISHLFRDPILRAVFAAGERDSGAAPVMSDPRPCSFDGGAARLLELA